jgi:polysaccharide export outer membrane protein
MRSKFVAFGLTLALTLATAYSAGAAPAKGGELPPPDGAVAVRLGDENYRIGPQDVLDINVFQVPDLTRTVTVDTGGKVLLPLVGQLVAAGTTPAELSANLAKALEQKYMRDPQVVVSVKEASSQKVTVDGAVQSPGIYALPGPTTLMQAFALAKGVDSRLANIKKVAVIRTVQNKKVAGLYNLAAIRQGEAIDPQVYGQDVVIVDTSKGKSFLRDFSQAFPILNIIPFL